MEIEVSLVKQWFWCSRYVYFRYVLGLDEPKFEFLREGKQLHESLTRLEEVRKTLLARREFLYDRKLLQLRVYSRRFGLKGILDMLVIRNGRPIPVEIKLAESARTVPLHHKAQLMAYALCLEEMFCKSVTRGYLYYARDDRLVGVYLSDDLRRVVIESLDKVRSCLRGEFIPPRIQDESKCRNCWFRRYCQHL